MFPILYESITAGQVPAHNGLGILTDCISCKVEQSRNGKYELSMEYAISGHHAEELAERRIIKAKPNFTDNPQLFRIDRVEKTMNGSLSISAKHISYDLSGYEITSGTASSAPEACLLLQSKASGYTITTDKTTTATFKITEPSSVRSWFVGKQGSFLDVFGGADIKYDNFSIQFLKNAGADRGVTIRYKKNLLELSQEIQDTLYTDVLCFWKNEDVVVTGNKVSTGLTLDVPKCLIIDCSQDYDNPPSIVDLTNKATAYKNSNNLTTPSNNIKLDFAQSKELSERVDLCDTVSIYYEALGITRVGVKCIRTVWDVIREKYVETEFGDSQADFVSTMAVNTKKIEAVPSKSFMDEAIAHATELITGNLGGYVILHDSNGDGEPDEILIMDTADITTSSKLWRWNKNGLGYSSTGYSGSYGTAITADGQIVADYISTGTLNANLIKVGIISDTQGNSTIDMASGIAKMLNFIGKGSITLTDPTGTKDKITLEHLNDGGSRIQVMSPNTSNVMKTGIWLESAYGLGTIRLGKNEQETIQLFGEYSQIRLQNMSDKLTFYLSGNDSSYGSQMYLADTTGRARTYIQGNGSILLFNSSSNETIGIDGQSGSIGMFNSSTTNTITLASQGGNITCVSLTQTSSRKVKKNIKPIEDSEKILDLQAVSFDYKDEEQGKDRRGFIAEDVEKVLPNLVTEATDTIPATLNYLEMIPYLQDVIKKQEKRISGLEEKIEKLYNEINKGE